MVAKVSASPSRVPYTRRGAIFGTMIYMLYHGYVDIYYWEYFLSLFYIICLYVWFSRTKKLSIKKHPEYKYFLSGYLAKVIGGIIFGLVYFYHYGGGDTIMYFYSSVATVKLALSSPLDYLHVIFGDNTPENRNLFNSETGWPYDYVYSDQRTWMVIRLLSPLVMLTFKSYLVTTVVLASVAYIGVWRCFRMFVGYFPGQMASLAVCFLFVPSVIFWGSGVSKDTFTLSGTCYFICAVDLWFFKKERNLRTFLTGTLSAALVIYVKPYIFMALMPSMLLWVLYARITGIRNTLVKFVVIPFGFLMLVGGTIVFLSGLGDKLGKFSLDNAVTTAVLTNKDMTKNIEYGTNYFDIGEMDGTWSGLLSKAPIAVFAAMFRPHLGEVRNVVMLISALENAWLLWMVVATVLKGRIVFVPSFVLGNPIVLMCLSFSVVFAFVIGISTPNFGALVRFKIPMLPLLLTGLLVLRHLFEERLRMMKARRLFVLERYREGDPPEVREEAIARNMRSVSGGRP
jgi:hypothetical protein